MKVLIIEDEPISSRRLKRMLMELEPELITEGPAATISEVENILAEEMDYDLIVSDIRLQGRTVFEAFKKRKPQCPVIFTTAYDEFALEAFKNNGIDYLLKPIDIEELSNALRTLGLIRPFKIFPQRILFSQNIQHLPQKLTHTKSHPPIRFSA